MQVDSLQELLSIQQNQDTVYDPYMELINHEEKDSDAS